MNSENLWMKFTVVVIIIVLGGASYVLYKFLYDDKNEFINSRFLPVPELDIESYDKLIRSPESESTTPQ